ncbi:MAG: EAL domain-containing protein [Pseudohongiellaceae bacterium]
MNVTGQLSKKPNLLVAEDEVEIADIIEAVAEDLGFQVSCVYEGAQVVALVKKLAPDVIALDLRMPGADGVEIIRELAKMNCRAKIVLMSGMDQRTLSSVQNLGREQKLDIIATLAKPMSLDAIEKVFSPHSVIAERPQELPGSQKRQLVCGYGMQTVFEPDVSLTPEPDSAMPRLTVNLQWRKDDGETLTGAGLFSWAEKQGIGKGLAELLFRDTFCTWRTWSDNNFCPEISLKLDGFLLRDLEIPDILAQLTDFFQIDHSKIILEIDQKAISANSNLVRDILSRLRIKGFKLSVSLDGDGESFIPMLDSLPIDEIIVDLHSLPVGFASSATNMETEFVYSSLTSLARRKGMTVAARNVNRQDLHLFAKQCGFVRARGSQISSSLSVEDVIDYYAKDRTRQLNG